MLKLTMMMWRVLLFFWTNN